VSDVCLFQWPGSVRGFERVRQLLAALSASGNWMVAGRIFRFVALVSPVAVAERFAESRLNWAIGSET